MGDCMRSGGDHAFAYLGIEDDGRFAHRCGNCLRIGHSEERDGPIVTESEAEEGVPDPVRVAISARSNAA